MRLKDYGRNQKKRKEYIHQSGLLLVGVDVSKAKHDACIGMLDGVKSRIGFTNSKDGFKRFEEVVSQERYAQIIKYLHFLQNAWITRIASSASNDG